MLLSFLRSLSIPTQHPLPTPPGRCRLSLEILEDRAVPASIVFDFEDLTPLVSPPNPSTATIPAYQSEGFTFDTTFTNPDEKFDVWGEGHPRFAGSTALSANSLARITLSKDDGGAFDLQSMALSRYSLATPPDVNTVTFTGTKEDGSQVTQTVTVTEFGFNAFPFADFQGVVSVSWDHTNRFSFHQFDDVAVEVERTVEVDVDLQPNKKRDVIRSQSRGKVAVALLSTAAFDATTQVDMGSLTFGRTGEEDSLVRQGRAGKPKVQIKDVNGDGRADLVVFFETEQTGLRPGDLFGILRGRTTGGDLLQGMAAVEVV